MQTGFRETDSAEMGSQSIISSLTSQDLPLSVNAGLAGGKRKQLAGISRNANMLGAFFVYLCTTAVLASVHINLIFLFLECMLIFVHEYACECVYECVCGVGFTCVETRQPGCLVGLATAEEQSLLGSHTSRCHNSGHTPTHSVYTLHCSYTSSGFSPFPKGHHTHD